MYTIPLVYNCMPLPRSICLIVVFSCLTGITLASDEDGFSPSGKSYLSLNEIKVNSNYTWKHDIVTTFFWIGEGATSYSDSTVFKSAWDSSWTQNYGGEDNPTKRVASDKMGGTSLPKRFAPTLNPFYVALPFNDVKYPELARKYVPWWNQKKWEEAPYVSQCKGRWIMIEYNGRVCFAQWQDVGPIRYDHVRYVFGDERPTRHSRAGLDISPAIKDYLGLNSNETTNWRFVEDTEVPYGPWIKYGEEALVFKELKAKPQKKHRS